MFCLVVVVMSVFVFDSCFVFVCFSIVCLLLLFLLVVCLVIFFCVLYFSRGLFSYFFCILFIFFFFKQKTAYEMRISDWSSDVCSSDLGKQILFLLRHRRVGHVAARDDRRGARCQGFGVGSQP